MFDMGLSRGPYIGIHGVYESLVALALHRGLQNY